MIEFQAGEWEGLENLGEDELEKLRGPAEDAVRRGAMHYANAIKKLLTGTRSGRIYPRRGRKHQASAPGEPPAIDRGLLRQSITWSEPKWTGWEVASEVGTNHPAGRRLEYGGVDRRGVRILPRPYFEPAALQEQAELERILQRTVA